MPATKPSLIQFSEAEIREIQRAALMVWDECAYDVLQGVADEKRKSANVVTVSRAVVIEIVLDAGRPEENLRRATRGWDPTVREDFFRRYAAASYRQLIGIVKPAFPCAHWGL